MTHLHDMNQFVWGYGMVFLRLQGTVDFFYVLKYHLCMVYQQRGHGWPRICGCAFEESIRPISDRLKMLYCRKVANIYRRLKKNTGIIYFDESLRFRHLKCDKNVYIYC